MDGTFRMLDLVSGANTTVQQLHQQMLQVMAATGVVYYESSSSVVFVELRSSFVFFR